MVLVLHVDREEMFSELTKLYLKNMDYKLEIDHVSSGGEALARLKIHSHDIIISAYRLPVKNGLDLLEELKKNGVTVPFIMLTGERNRELEMMVYDLGADYFIQKRGNPAAMFVELYQAIMELVMRKTGELEVASVV